MHAPLGQLPDQPGIDCAKGEFASFGLRASAFNIVEQPADFGGRKITVNDEAGLLSDQRPMASVAQIVAEVYGSAVLPYDGVGDRLPGFSVPQDSGFALIRDGDRRNRLQRDSVLLEGRVDDFPHDLQLRGPDGICIVLNPTEVGKNLFEFDLCSTDNFASRVKQNRT